MRVGTVNWMQLEEYLSGDDRIVLPLGSVEQHGYLSLAVDQILSERVSVEAAEPLGVPVLPALPYGITPYFAAYPGSPTLSARPTRPSSASCSTRCTGRASAASCSSTATGATTPAATPRDELERRQPGRAGASGTTGGTGRAPGRSSSRSTRTASHASWLENFPWTRLDGRRAAAGAEADGRHRDDARARPGRRARDARRRLARRRSTSGRDEDVLRVWQAGVEEVRRPDRERLGECLTSAAARRSSPARRTGSAPRSRPRSSGTAQPCTASTATRSTSPTPAQVAALVERIGPVDILVNNAGGVVGQVGRPLEEVTDEDWRAVVDANLTSTFVCTRAVVPGMKAAGYGRIVNISSGAGRSVSLTGIQAYASAKAGQIGFTRQTAHELGPFGITVNSIAPGFVLSNPTSIRQWESYGEEGQQALARAHRDRAGSGSRRTSPTASSSSSPRRRRG